MKVLTAITLALALVWIAIAAHAVPPLPSKPNTDKMEGWCNEHGGVYWPPGPESSTYGCYLPDGSVVVCGGSLPGCDVIEPAVMLPPSKLPLDVIGVALEVPTQGVLEDIQDQLDLLEGKLDALAVLVEDECEPPIFVP